MRATCNNGTYWWKSVSLAERVLNDSVYSSLTWWLLLLHRNQRWVNPIYCCRRSSLQSLAKKVHRLSNQPAKICPIDDDCFVLIKSYLSHHFFQFRCVRLFLFGSIFFSCKNASFLLYLSLDHTLSSFYSKSIKERPIRSTNPLIILRMIRLLYLSPTDDATIASFCVLSLYLYFFLFFPSFIVNSAIVSDHWMNEENRARNRQNCRVFICIYLIGFIPFLLIIHTSYHIRMWRVRWTMSK